MKTPTIQPARRIQQVSEYYFSTKLQQIREMNLQEPEVINLGIGSPDGMPAPAVIDTLQASSRKPENHGYQSYTGIPALRNAFSVWYQKYYLVDLDPATEILPLMGSKEGIMHISMAFLNPGDGVLVPNPGYPAYAAVANLVEARILTYPLLEERNWQPDLEDLERQDLSGIKLMWVNYPNMPTGQAADPDFFIQLIAFGRKHNILIINDNPYSFILNKQPLSLLSTPGALDIALELNSLSKSQNMAGWRMGMVAGRKEFIQYILKVKSNMDSGQFKPLQEAAAEALRLDESWYAGINASYALRRELIWKLFDLLECTYSKTQNGLFVWARIPEDSESGQALAESLLQEARVFITPGFIFGTQGDRFLRASLCQPTEVIENAIKRIKNLS